MLQIAVGAKGKALLKPPLGIKLYQVESDILYPRLGLLLQRFPGIAAQFIDLGRLSVLPVVFRDLMQGVDAQVQDIPLSVN